MPRSPRELGAGRPAGPGRQPVAHLGEQAVDDRPQVAAVRRGDRPLPLVGGADGEDPLDVGELGLAAEPLRRRREVLDEVQDRLPDRPDGALLVDDDVGVEAVAGGPPLVLPQHPARPGVGSV